MDKFLNHILNINLSLMKKTIALFSSLLIFAGLKAQTTAPAVKKETVKPGTVQPTVLTTDSAKNTALKQAPVKIIKYDHIKKTPETVQLKEAPAQVKQAPVQMKESPVAKPHKG
jgi:hypothetical protein